MVSHDSMPAASVGGFASYITNSFLVDSSNDAFVASVLFLLFIFLDFRSFFRFFDGLCSSDGSADELDAD